MNVKYHSVVFVSENKVQSGIFLRLNFWIYFSVKGVGGWGGVGAGGGVGGGGGGVGVGVGVGG